MGATGSARGMPPCALTRPMQSTNARSGCSAQRRYGGGHAGEEGEPRIKELEDEIKKLQTKFQAHPLGEEEEELRI